MKSSTVRLARESDPEMTAPPSMLVPADHLPAMPGGVMARIERALAAEAARRTAQAPSGVSRGQAQSGPSPGPGYRPTAPSSSSRMRSA